MEPLTDFSLKLLQWALDDSSSTKDEPFSYLPLDWIG